jgi:hypothetical protein
MWRGNKMFRLQKIKMNGNEHGQLRANTIYAELVDLDGKLEISATLEHILSVIRDNDLPVEGVTIHKKAQLGAYRSEVTLDLYKSVCSGSKSAEVHCWAATPPVLGKDNT